MSTVLGNPPQKPTERPPRLGTLSSRFGVTSRLVVLALLPIIVLTLVSVPFADRVRVDARSAQAASQSVGMVTTAIKALDAMVVEDSYTVTLRAITQNGYTAQYAEKLLGFDVSTDMSRARSATDEALQVLPASERSSIEIQLGNMRTAMDRTRVSASALSVGYNGIATSLQDLVSSSYATAEHAALSTSSSVGAKESLLVLGNCDQLLTAALQQVTDEAKLWFTATTPEQTAAVALAHADALFDQAGAGLAQSGVSSVAEAWAAFKNNPATVSYDVLLSYGELGVRMPFVGGKFAPNAPGTIPIAILVGAYKAIDTHWALISQVMDQAGTTVRAQMTSVARSNSDDYRLWVLLLVAAILAVLAVAVLVARSLSKPLGRLADAACSVVDGHLDMAKLSTAGPRQTAVVADAFNSLMSNLQLLEAKSQALANCDFDNEVLAVPLPGQLGAALQDSVHVLAGSIQDRHELQQRLAHEATHDTLTGLFNRAAAISFLEQALIRGRRRSETTAVLYVDLDNFKQANDLHGHSCGDHILRQVGGRLASGTRSGDIVARLGGDEFIVIAEQIDGIEEAEYLAQRLIGSLSEALEWESVSLRVGACVGITICRGDEVGALDLLARADLALYQAKQRGGGAIGIYDEELQLRLAERDAVERDLRDELQAGGPHLVLHYQPLVDSDKGLCGMEALVRWDRAGHGLVPPLDFVPVAELSDLIIELDRWVLNGVTAQVAAWSEDPILSKLSVSVNVSGRHLLSKQLPTNLREVLARTGIDARNLVVEITETVLLNDLTVAAGELDEVRAMGIKVAVDDFGTGYTSLAHLHHLPVDSIKIDRTFVSDVAQPADASLVRMITELARHLGLTTVSEGVETDEQFDTLQALGSDCMQGYLIARPMSAGALEIWSKQHPSVPPRAPTPTA